MAPEYARSGSLSFKSDIYSFGVLVLEIVSGQRIRKVSFNNIPKQEEGLVQCVSGITLFKMIRFFARNWRVWFGGKFSFF